MAPEHLSLLAHFVSLSNTEENVQIDVVLLQVSNDV